MDAFNLDEKTMNGGAYLLSGDDGYLLQIAVNFFRGLLPEGSLSLHVIDKFTSVDELSDCLGVYSFDGSPNVVIVDAPDNVKLTDEDHKSLLALLQRGVAPDYAVFRNGSFLTAAEKKLLTVINCQKPNKYGCIAFAEKLFPYGIEKSAVALLADYTDNSLAKINNEKEKLLAYCGDRKVTLSDVENLVSEDNELQVFSFANAVASGNTVLAMKQLEKMRIYGVAPSTILSTLTNQFQRMLFCALSPLSDEELAALMKVKPFAIEKTRSGKKLKSKILKDNLGLLLECEYKFKSGEITDEAALNIAVSKLLEKEQG